MPHVVLLGDSVFDNGAYVGREPAVIDHLRALLPSGWKATLLAVDGSVVADVPRQLARLPADATHLALSVGGNDALGHADLLGARVASIGEALLRVAQIGAAFRDAYAAMLRQVRARGLPVVTSTIYDLRPDGSLEQRAASAAVAVFNDAILRESALAGVSVLDLRLTVAAVEDYANAIEPSAIGGRKIARAILLACTQPGPAGRTTVFVGRG